MKQTVLLLSILLILAFSTGCAALRPQPQPICITINNDGTTTSRSHSDPMLTFPGQQTGFRGATLPSAYWGNQQFRPGGQLVNYQQNYGGGYIRGEWRNPYQGENTGWGNPQSQMTHPAITAGIQRVAERARYNSNQAIINAAANLQ